MPPDITADPVFSPEPKEAAGSMLHAPRPGVTRYKRNVVIGIISALVGVFALGLIIAFAFTGKKEVAKKDEDTPVQISNPDLTELPQTYSDPRTARPELVSATVAGAPGTAGLPAAGTDPNAIGSTSGAPTTPTGATGANNQPTRLTPAQQRAEDARNLAIKQEMAARSGPVIVPEQRQQVAEAGPPGLAPNTEAAPGRPPQAIDPDEPGRQNMQSQKNDFIQSARISEDYLSAELQAPRSDYEVKAGTIIPAALVTALNSNLPGEVIAAVTENVYDHVTGRYVLIPQGTRLFGKYDSKVAYKQQRAIVVWNRIIYPNGTSINIGGMIGADATGAVGLADRVDNHVPGLVGGILLSTAISVGGAAADNAGTRDNQLVTAGGGAISQDASRTGQQFVQRELDRQPTITIRPGYRLRVLVNKDMVLAPY